MGYKGLFYRISKHKNVTETSVALYWWKDGQSDTFDSGQKKSCTGVNNSGLIKVTLQSGKVREDSYMNGPELIQYS